MKQVVRSVYLLNLEILINSMKKIEIQNFSFKGILNSILMKTEKYFKVRIYGKIFHHAYIGLSFLIGGIIFNIFYLNFIGTLLIVHDVFSHIVREFKKNRP